MNHRVSWGPLLDVVWGKPAASRLIDQERAAELWETLNTQRLQGVIVKSAIPAPLMLPEIICVPSPLLEKLKTKVVTALHQPPTLRSAEGNSLGTCAACSFVGLADEDCPACVGRCTVCTKQPCGHVQRWRAQRVIGAAFDLANEELFNVLRKDGVVCSAGAYELAAFGGIQKVVVTVCREEIDFGGDAPLPDWTLQPVTCLTCIAEGV